MVARQTRLQIHTRSHPPSQCGYTEETMTDARCRNGGDDEKSNGAAHAGGGAGRGSGAENVHGIQTAHAHAQTHARAHGHGTVSIGGEGAHSPHHGLYGPDNDGPGNNVHYRHHQIHCHAHHPYHDGCCGDDKDARHIAVAVGIDAVANGTTMEKTPKKRMR